MKNVIEKVRIILTREPVTRDNDFKLFFAFWTSESTHYEDFLYDLNKGLHTHPESIRRARQRLQQLHPELRGEKYEPRHKHQKKVKEELGYKA